MVKRLLAAVLAFVAMSVFAAIDVNKATSAELDAVKGIGPAIAGRITAERAKSPFKDWDDLVGRVSGIGEKTATKFSESGLTVNGATYKGVAAKPAAAAPAATKPAATAAATPAAPAPAADAKSADKMTKKEKAEAKKEAKAQAKADAADDKAEAKAKKAKGADAVASAAKK